MPDRPPAFWKIHRYSETVLWGPDRAREEEKYREIKKELLTRIYRMDYAGYDLLKSAMGDLASYHRLISFREEIEQVMAVSFEQVKELAHYLSEERHFCWITLP